MACGEFVSRQAAANNAGEQANDPTVLSDPQRRCRVRGAARRAGRKVLPIKVRSHETFSSQVKRNRVEWRNRHAASTSAGIRAL